MRSFVLVVLSLLLLGCSQEATAPAALGPFGDTGGSDQLMIVAPVEATRGLQSWNDRIVMTSLARGDYTECAELAELKGAYLCVSTNMRVMNAIWFRASTFVEGNVDGEPNHLLSITGGEYLDSSQWAAGMDLRGEDLVAFWEAAEQACTEDASMCGSEEERVAFEEVVLPLAARNEPFVIITYEISGEWPWRPVASHEVLHAQYFLLDNYRATVDAFWEQEVTPEGKDEVRRLLDYRYNLDDEYLVRNEFQAYMLAFGASMYQLAPLIPLFRESLEQALIDAGTPPLCTCE